MLRASFWTGCIFVVEALCWLLERICAAWTHSGSRWTEGSNNLNPATRYLGLPDFLFNCVFFYRRSELLKFPERLPLSCCPPNTHFLPPPGSVVRLLLIMEGGGGAVGGTGGTSSQQRETYSCCCCKQRVPGDICTSSARGVRGKYIKIAFSFPDRPVGSLAGSVRIISNDHLQYRFSLLLWRRHHLQFNAEGIGLAVCNSRTSRSVTTSPRPAFRRLNPPMGQVSYP